MNNTANTNQAPEVVATFTNEEYGIASYVTIGTVDGLFHVSLKDTDAGEFLPMTTITADKEQALNIAAQWANGGPVGCEPFFPFPSS